MAEYQKDKQTSLTNVELGKKWQPLCTVMYCVLNYVHPVLKIFQVGHVFIFNKPIFTAIPIRNCQQIYGMVTMLYIVAVCWFIQLPALFLARYN